MGQEPWEGSGTYPAKINPSTPLPLGSISNLGPAKLSATVYDFHTINSLFFITITVQVICSTPVLVFFSGSQSHYSKWGTQAENSKTFHSILLRSRLEGKDCMPRWLQQIPINQVWEICHTSYVRLFQFLKSWCKKSFSKWIFNNNYYYLYLSYCFSIIQITVEWCYYSLKVAVKICIVFDKKVSITGC